MEYALPASKLYGLTRLHLVEQVPDVLSDLKSLNTYMPAIYLVLWCYLQGTQLLAITFSVTVMACSPLFVLGLNCHAGIDF